MPFCTSCGHQNADEARFCNGCGQQMPVATQQAPTTTAASTASPPLPPPAQPQPTPPPPPHQQTAYQQPAYQQQQGYQQPYRPRKDKTTATLIAWLFWPAFDFYLGNTGKGIGKLLTFGGFGIWALIDAIKILLMSQQEFDWRYNS